MYLFSEKKNLNFSNLQKIQKNKSILNYTLKNKNKDNIK